MRKHRTREQWLELVEKQKSSGLSIIQFCRNHNINHRTFYGFNKREASRRRNDETTDFVEVVKPALTNPGTPQALIRIGTIEIIPGQQPDQETMALLFKAALEAIHASL